VDGVSVIVPAYNESHGIVSVLKQVQGALEGINHELLVVDDGSTDDTFPLASGVQGTRVISHGANLGYGASLKTGLRQAKYDTVMIIDADATYPEGAIPELVRRSTDADMVVGARTGRVEGEQALRRIVKNIIVWLANWLAETRIPDLNSGLRVFRRDLGLKYIHLLPSGFSFTATITLVLLSEGYRVEYMPIEYRKRKGWSKFRPFQDTLNMIILILRTLVYFNPLRVFVPLSVALVVLAFFVLGLSLAIEGRAWDITIIAILTAAIQVFGIGLIADLIGKRYKL